MINQKGIDVKTGNTIIEISERYFRPIETDFLLGDSTKAGKILGWKPRVKFKDLVKIMVDAESGK